jgi:hypothetical protein
MTNGPQLRVPEDFNLCEPKLRQTQLIASSLKRNQERASHPACSKMQTHDKRRKLKIGSLG